MNKLFFSAILTSIIIVSGNVSQAQIVGTDVFMQGQFVEIGQNANGSFGACTSPLTYHAHTSFGPLPTPGGALAEVYDWGHDGWTVGTPSMMGDYTQPGFPFEGWSVEVAGVKWDAWQSCTGASTAGLTGSNTGYSNTGGRSCGYWTGSAGPAGALAIRNETRVDTLASWVVVTAVLTNTSALPMTGVYYMRCNDPDNVSTWGGGSCNANTIVYQNDPQHRVLVSSKACPGTTGPTGDTTYFGLGTKDCRAKATICMSTGLTPGANLISAIYNSTVAGFPFTLGFYNAQDQGVALVYDLGTIAPFDSAIVSYAYIFAGDASLDSAFPAPILTINGMPVTNFPDTFDACTLPVGTDTVRLGALLGTDKAWSWAHWTWSPATALSATTGTSVLANLNLIPGFMTYTLTGNDSSNGMHSCQTAQYVFTIKSCHSTVNNGPCEGDSLKFKYLGDSIGATYFWYSHTHPFTSTRRNPFKYPATLGDTGWYYGVKTVGTFHDTDSTYVIIHPKPIMTATNNSPLCNGALATMVFSVTPVNPGDNFVWWGPGSYNGIGPNPNRPFFGPADVGTYFVEGTTAFGCKDTASTITSLIAPPNPPLITGVTPYCQNDIFVPFTVYSVSPGGTVLWYTAPVGGVGSTTPLTINTSFPGYQTVYASQIVGSCEGPRGSFTTRIITTPAAPLAVGTMAYCQYIGPFVPLTVTTTPTGQAWWYTSATGGTGDTTEPVVDLTVAGPHYYWVSQRDSGCEGPRLPITIMVNPKPAPPVVTTQQYCQFMTPVPALIATPLAGHTLTWFGPGLPSGGSPVAPIPATNIAGIDTYYVNQTSTFGCISDKSVDAVLIKPKPEPPFTVDTTYCQFFNAPPLTAVGQPFSLLKWYLAGTLLPGAPVPPTGTPGSTIWYVSQTVNGCEGDSAALKVTVIFKPQVNVIPRNPWVCQFDSITLAFDGPSLVEAGYKWTLPNGAAFATNTNGTRSIATDSMVKVRFDSSNQNNYVYLMASDNNGKCTTIDTVRIKVVPEPIANSYTKQDVCLGDTVSMALGYKTPNASIFTWKIDQMPFATSTAVSIISHDSHSGGPYLISWIDSGKHIIQLNSFTDEGCTSKPTFDSVNVHAAPDATFKIVTGLKGICLEDSVKFEANSADYNNSYTWTPEHFFNNINKPTVWGRVEQSKSMITLIVTDPFGCSASNTVEIDPANCCTITFPNAFTPGKVTGNNIFRPIYDGFHRFHTFRITNRWGQVIFESANTNPSWDGNYNGVPQDMGVYFFYIKYDCGGNVMEEKGDVTLVR